MINIMRTLIISILLLTFFTTELISTNIPSKSYFQNNPKKKKKKHKKKKTLAHRQINNPDIQKSELESMSDTPNLVQWTNMAHVVDTFTSSVDIALVGKYTGLSDS